MSCTCTCVIIQNDHFWLFRVVVLGTTALIFILPPFSSNNNHTALSFTSKLLPLRSYCYITPTTSSFYSSAGSRGDLLLVFLLSVVSFRGDEVERKGATSCSSWLEVLWGEKMFKRRGGGGLLCAWLERVRVRLISTSKVWKVVFTSSSVSIRHMSCSSCYVLHGS